MKRIRVAAFWITIVFTWEHGGANVDGYHFYKGTSISKMQRIATIESAQSRSYKYEYNDKTKQYFGVSAYNRLGESAITSTGPDGKRVAFGPPDKPAGLVGTAK